MTTSVKDKSPEIHLPLWDKGLDSKLARASGHTHGAFKRIPSKELIKMAGKDRVITYKEIVNFIDKIRQNQIKMAGKIVNRTILRTLPSALRESATASPGSPVDEETIQLAVQTIRISIAYFASFPSSQQDGLFPAGDIHEGPAHFRGKVRVSTDCDIPANYCVFTPWPTHGDFNPLKAFYEGFQAIWNGLVKGDVV